MQNHLYDLNTRQILTGAAIALSVPLIYKAVNKYLKQNRYKYPTEIDLSIKSSRDYFNKNYEQCLINWCMKYPNGCTLNLNPTGFFNRTDGKIILVNSVESIKEFSKNDSIAYRPQMFLLDVISHHYQGSFFRMYNSDLNEVRKTSTYGLHKLVLSNPEAEPLVSDELESFFAFIDKDVVKGDSGLIENAQIYIQQVIVNIVFRVGLDMRFDYDLDKSAAVKTQMDFMSKLLSSLNLLELSRITAENAGSEKNAKTVEYLGGVVGSLYKFIKDAVVGYKQQQQQAEGDVEIKTLGDLLLQKQKEEILKKLKLESGDLYSDDDIIVQVFTVFLASCGTTGFTLSWALYYLAKSPKVVAKILDEIQRVCGDTNFISWKQRPNMLYTEATLNEILRLSSTQALIPRATCCEVNINGFCIPANTPVLLNTYGIHHNTKNWSNPLEFSPERWLNDDGKSLNLKKDCFMPFGVAPRSCIGDTMSKALLFSILVNFLNRFSIEYVPVASEKNGNEGVLGVMRCPHEFNLKLVRRN
jgi:hypothetical protein